MGHLIRGWRRRSGIVTLLVALLLMCGWFRSQSICEWVTICSSKHMMYTVSSSDAEISWTRSSDPPPVDGPRIWWGANVFSGLEITDWTDNGSLHRPDPVIAHIPYWMIVLPLTAFSAYLLFPRRATHSHRENRLLSRPAQKFGLG